ncbi:MAG: exodeoxyribonuclease VII large subunit [Candidatus Saccharimonadales bacterium]
MIEQDIIFSVSDFVAATNQTLEFAYSSVVIEGELTNFKVSKNKWVYFDLKDDDASVRFFGTVYMLPGPLEDGMLMRVRGTPRLHPLYGFSVTVQNMQPVGEGAIRRASNLLQTKLAAEGLFDEERKRLLPYPPVRIGLIASKESAAFIDFMKILNARWGGMEIVHVDVQVQGEQAPGQVVRAIEQLNLLADSPEVIVITRGGGSPDDLQAFSTEQVTRAVAGSRIPTLVAIGHEIDVCLAELAADQRASTPSNAAELLTPDKRALLLGLDDVTGQFEKIVEATVQQARGQLGSQADMLSSQLDAIIKTARQQLEVNARVLAAINPATILRRGYAIVRRQGKILRSAGLLSAGDIVNIEFNDGHTVAKVE